MPFFSHFSGLKSNLSKCEIAGIGVLKGVQVAVCIMHCVDLNNDTLKILGSHFSYSKKLKEKKNLLRDCSKYSTSTEIVKNNHYPANIYIFKVNNRDTIKRCEICSKSTIKTPERRQ